MVGGYGSVRDGDDRLEIGGHRLFEAVDPVVFYSRDGKATHNGWSDVVRMGFVDQSKVQKFFFGDVDPGHRIGCGDGAHNHRRATTKSARKGNFVDEGKSKLVGMASELSIVLVEDGDEHIVALEADVLGSLSFDGYTKKSTSFDPHHVA